MKAISHFIVRKSDSSTSPAILSNHCLSDLVKDHSSLRLLFIADTIGVVQQQTCFKETKAVKTQYD